MNLSRHFFNSVSSCPCCNCNGKTIVSIDFRLPNCDTLLQQVVPEARVFVLGSHSDGVRDLTEILHRSPCREVHLMCLGSPGCLYLGNSELSLNTLLRYETELQKWFAACPNDKSLDSPRLFLSGCNVAAGDGGAEFITKLSLMTGAKIAASVNPVNSKILS